MSLDVIGSRDGRDVYINVNKQQFSLDEDIATNYYVLAILAYKSATDSLMQYLSVR
jgi:hypothetical protein